jgi:hypothetical protein
MRTANISGGLIEFVDPLHDVTGHDGITTVCV